MVNVRGYPVLVASLDDTIRSKELADRPKDRQSLPELRRFRDQQTRDREGPGLSFDLYPPVRYSAYLISTWSRFGGVTLDIYGDRFFSG